MKKEELLIILILLLAFVVYVFGSYGLGLLFLHVFEITYKWTLLKALCVSILIIWFGGINVSLKKEIEDEDNK